MFAAVFYECKIYIMRCVETKRIQLIYGSTELDTFRPRNSDFKRFY